MIACWLFVNCLLIACKLLAYNKVLDEWLRRRWLLWQMHRILEALRVPVLKASPIIWCKRFNKVSINEMTITLFRIKYRIKTKIRTETMPERRGLTNQDATDQCITLYSCSFSNTKTYLSLRLTSILRFQNLWPQLRIQWSHRQYYGSRKQENHRK